MILGVCIRNCDYVQGRVGAPGYCVAIVTLTGTEKLISPILVRYIVTLADNDRHVVCFHL